MTSPLSKITGLPLIVLVGEIGRYEEILVLSVEVIDVIAEEGVVAGDDVVAGNDVVAGDVVIIDFVVDVDTCDVLGVVVDIVLEFFCNDVVDSDTPVVF